MKDEREILTRQTILKKLIYETKRSMIGSLLMCFLGAIVFGMMYLMLLSFHYVTFETKLIFIIFISLYFLAYVFFFVRALIRIVKAKRGNFTVVEDILTEIDDNQLSIIQLILYGGWHTLFGNKSHLKHVFLFQSEKMFIANVEEYKNTRLDAVAEFSMPGDSFYLVFYNDNPNKIILLFSSKVYAYKEGK